MNTQEMCLGLDKRTGGQRVVIAQGDMAGTTLVATVYDGGARLAEGGLRAYFVMGLPDREHYVMDAAEYEGGVITYTLDEAHAAAVAGTTDVAYFELRRGGEVIASTERFTVTVLPSAYDGHEPAEDWNNAISKLVTDGEEAIADIEATDAAVKAAEDARVAAEDARASAETARAAAEQTREGNEATRKANETSRGNAETARAKAEAARATAEDGRKTDFATMVGEFNEAKREAVGATDRANEAADDATAAAAAARAAARLHIEERNYGSKTYQVLVIDDE